MRRLLRLMAGLSGMLSVLVLNQAQAAPWPEGLPVYSHIVIVIEENKNYEQIIGSADAPYINQLAAESALFTQAYGEEHESQGNYFWLFAGDRFNLGFDDRLPEQDFHARNLGQQLIEHGLKFKGYAQDLPKIGATDEFAGKPPCGNNCGYARKHVPWVSFPDLCKSKTVEYCANLPLTNFYRDFSKLPTVSIVIPDLINDMHSVAFQDPDREKNISREVRQGDTWLKAYFGPYVEWAKANNSLLIVTFDENDDASGYKGLTDPKSPDPVIRNRIATIFAGAHIKPGQYAEGAGITHVNILRTLEAMYRLRKSGAQQANAQQAGIADDYIVTDVFVPETSDQ